MDAQKEKNPGIFVPAWAIISAIIVGLHVLAAIYR